MADYQDIRGLRVKYLSADPADPEGGQVWYNSTTGTLRSRLVSGAWSSSAPLNIPMTSLGQGTGIQTAALQFGGYPSSNITQGYDGTAWSTRPSLATARKYLAGFGTPSSAVVAGGATPSYQNATEEWTGETSTANIETLTTS